MNSEHPEPTPTRIMKALRPPESRWSQTKDKVSEGWGTLVGNERFQLALIVLFGLLTVFSATWGDRIQRYQILDRPADYVDETLPDDTVGGKASRDVFATHDFTRLNLVNHEENRAREEARAAVHPIWVHDESRVNKIQDNIRSAFRGMREDLCQALVQSEATLVAEATDGSETPQSPSAECRRSGLAEGQLSTAERRTAACSAAARSRFAQRLQIDDFSVNDCNAVAENGASARFQNILHDKIADVMMLPIVDDLPTLQEHLQRGIQFERRIDRNEASTREPMTSADKFRAIDDVRQRIERDEEFQVGDLDKSLRSPARKLLSALVVSNTFYDQDTTEALRDKEAGLVIAEIGTREFRRGERILSAGQVIEPSDADTVTQMNLSAPRVVSWGWDAGALLTLLVLTLASMYLAGKSFGYRWSTRDITMMGALLLINVGLIRLGTNLADQAHLNTAAVLSREAWLLLLPYAAGAVVVSAISGTGNAVAFSIILSLVVAALTRYELAWFLVPLLSSLAGCVAADRIKRRSQLAIATFFAAFGQVAITFALIMAGVLPKNLIQIQLLVALIGSGVLNFFIAFGLTAIVEWLFNYTTAFRLQEWLSTDNRLMNELNRAAGTYAHSQNVAQLVHEACNAIGADGLLGRAGATYHDIGKIRNALYFAENQHGESLHNALTPRESAAIIRAHVTDGVKMAKAAKLPKELIEFIQTHHGTSYAGHFYILACNEEGSENVDPADFQYPGPPPSTKETAVCLLADGVEASVTAISKKGPMSDDAIKQQIDKIFEGAIAKGQLEQAPLTMKDLAIVKEVFFQKLRGMHHSRPTYVTAQTSAPKEALPPAQARETIAAPTPSSTPS